MDVKSELLRIADDGIIPEDFDDNLLLFLERHGCVQRDNGRSRLCFSVVEANGLTYLVEPEPPRLLPGEQAVYPFHDEATNILEAVAKCNEQFDYLIDGFCGGGHSMLPILHTNIAITGKGIDISPRAVKVARLNAELNALTSRAEFEIGDSRRRLPNAHRGNNLYICNAPFALAPKGIQLERMRNGGENGLSLTLSFIQNVILQIKPGDIICGLSYSLISTGGIIELQQAITKLLTPTTTLEVELLKGSTMWRGSNGKKEQSNPMALGKMSTKARPDDAQAVEIYNKATQQLMDQDWEMLGYFKFLIRNY
jgi:SAM-dependent methyltransferase